MTRAVFAPLPPPLQLDNDELARLALASPEGFRFVTGRDGATVALCLAVERRFHLLGVGTAWQMERRLAEVEEAIQERAEFYEALFPEEQEWQ